MGEAYNAGAWILGELTEPINQMRTNMFKPVRMKVDNADEVSIGDGADLLLGVANDKIMIPGDESALIGNSTNNWMSPIAILRTIKEPDGTMKVIFVNTPVNDSQNYLTTFTLDKDMMPIDCSRQQFHDYLGLSVTAAGYVFDCFYEEETDTEYYYAMYPSAVGSGFIHVKTGNTVKTYALNAPVLQYPTGYQAASLCTTLTCCEGGKFRKIGENVFLICNGGNIYMIQLVGTAAAVVATYTVRVSKDTYNNQGNFDISMFVDTDRKRVFAFSASQQHTSYAGKGTVFLYVLTYDIDNPTLSLVSEHLVCNSDKNYTLRVDIPKQKEIMPEPGEKWEFPALLQFGSSNPQVCFCEIDEENNVSFSLVPDVGSWSHYILHATKDTLIHNGGNSRIVKTYKNGNKEAVSFCGFTTDVMAETSGLVFRPTLIDGILMYFNGTAHNKTGTTTVYGVGRCQYLFKANAVSLGIVIGKDESAGEVEVASVGVVRVNTEGVAGAELTSHFGTTTGMTAVGKFIDKNVLELYE